MDRAGFGTGFGPRIRRAAAVGALLGLAWPAAAQTKGAPPAAAAGAPTTIERIRQTGRIRFGYRTDARPFSFRDSYGNPSGYSIALCQLVGEIVKSELALSSLAVEWVPVTVTNRFQSVQHGDVDLLCGADTETLRRREDVAFSIPIFPGGVGALLRADAPIRLKEILAGRPMNLVTWRGASGQLIQAQRFVVVKDTTAAPWLASRLNSFHLTGDVTPVDSYDAGIQALLARNADVFFGDRAILIDALARHPQASQLTLLDRQFTYEPLALVFAKGDDAFRLIVDRTLSRLYASGDTNNAYLKWFGEPNDESAAFFRWNTLPE